ncbi:MAG TPA: hypothetical protein VNZ22_06595, partial [Bacillota bacterium]|nr:hypothetical protein [Bacillota bacterium]
LAAGFAYSMKVETKLARNSGSETELEWMGRSTVEYCRWVLAEQMKITQEPFDALHQVWAGGSGGLATSNSPLANVQRTLQFRNGTATWKIIDLERKININTANEAMLQQAFLGIGVDAGDMTPIVGSILDWIDRDSNTHVQGAESDFYHSMDPPYEAKNGPIDDLSELLFIRGVTPELYWGPSSTNYVATKYEPRANRMGAQGPGYAAGLVDIFTPLSRGQINPYTASPTVLTIALGGNAMAADRIVELRSTMGQEGADGAPTGGPMGGPMGGGPMGGIDINSLLLSAGISQGQVQQVARGFSTRSSTFEVTVDAEVNGYHRQFTAVLGRTNPRDIQVLTFSWK